jgi:NAD(P)-dependent dehydrogenase (short-subunit alcohol dehydrogenase family)
MDAVAVVTGAAGGIGRAVAERLLTTGATVVAADVAEVAWSAHRLIPVIADISDEGDVARVVAAATAAGPLRALANVAAVTGAGLTGDGDVLSTPLEVWDRIIDVNLRGTMLMCRAALPALIEAGGGAIVNVSSAAAVRGARDLCAYSASKAAVNNLTMHIARAFGLQGIRCNAVMPGLVEGTGAMGYPGMTERHLEITKRMTSVGRLGQPRDIAEMVAFLLDDEQSGFVSGQILSCYGGL